MEKRNIMFVYWIEVNWQGERRRGPINQEDTCQDRFYKYKNVFRAWLGRREP
ncbi:hypothetical protein AMATHDRAFT_63147 [Amanita thiersii Skay4041]|uniref:Uncharacterized protein n=1 Tax=Amanita thiersii Skay4041 TaxID=703135 RepID=A0A2A9NPB3_9AGAR|nr:hypothetical protein AMATHDRAFT_63147 [Amanita thiersii Skay4041]